MATEEQEMILYRLATGSVSMRATPDVLTSVQSAVTTRRWVMQHCPAWSTSLQYRPSRQALARSAPSPQPCSRESVTGSMSPISTSSAGYGKEVRGAVRRHRGRHAKNVEAPDRYERDWWLLSGSQDWWTP